VGTGNREQGTGTKGPREQGNKGTGIRDQENKRTRERGVGSLAGWFRSRGRSSGASFHGRRPAEGDPGSSALRVRGLDRILGAGLPAIPRSKAQGGVGLWRRIVDSYIWPAAILDTWAFVRTNCRGRLKLVFDECIGLISPRLATDPMIVSSTIFRFKNPQPFRHG
jgi:hypothetical protein